MNIYTLSFTLTPEDLAIFKATPIVITKSTDTTLVPIWACFIPTIPTETPPSDKDSNSTSANSSFTYQIQWSDSSIIYGYILPNDEDLKSGQIVTQQYEQEVPVNSYNFNGDLFVLDKSDGSVQETKSYQITNKSLKTPKMLFGVTSEPNLTGNFRVLKTGLPAINKQYDNESIGNIATVAKQSNTSSDKASVASFEDSQSIHVFMLPAVKTQELLTSLPANAASFTFTETQQRAEATFDSQEGTFVITPKK